MKQIKELAKNKIAQATLFIVIGLLGGWLFFGSPTPEVHNHDMAKTSIEKQVWTCSMHPQIRKDEPGDCPICGMDLIPLHNTGSSSGGEVPENAMQMSEEAIALANVQTSMVSRKDPVKEVLLYGVVTPDERNLQSQTAHVGGRIEQLFVDFTGETVRKGETLAILYSPEVFTAQQELLEALKIKETQPQLVEAAREKLRLWKLTDAQIAKIEDSGIVTPTVEIKSNSSGIVMSKKVRQGDYVSSGSVLFDVANLSKLWVMFEAYEVDLAFLQTGNKLNFSLQAIPGKVFNSTIAFIDPILDKTTRTAKVRVEIANPNLEIKPEMYATATVTARLKQYNNQIVIPQSAVLWTGKRSIVYVSLSGYDTPVFQLREVELGPSLGDAYVVLSGLKDGEMIVSNGAFAIDASAQLEGKRSMMNDQTSKKMTGHEDHSMQDMEQTTHSTEHAQQEHAMLTVEGNCEMCKQRIEKAALSVNGVSSATWNATDKRLHLNFASGKTDLNAISKAIAKVGHDTEKDKADKKVYDALPGCCKYR